MKAFHLPAALVSLLAAGLASDVAHAALGLSRRNVGPSLHSTTQPPVPIYRSPRVR
jgi:hypothetical protein